MDLELVIGKEKEVPAPVQIYPLREGRPPLSSSILNKVRGMCNVVRISPSGVIAIKEDIT